MSNLEKYLNKITNGDCREVMKEMPANSIDLMVTSPPYGVGIAYDSFDDDMNFEAYKEFSREWLSEAFRVLKPDGRLALNIPYEINRQEKGGRIFMVAELWNILASIGYKFYGVVDLEESSPHRSKTTAWGSWMSPSSPYIYNPKECVLLCYKQLSKKQTKGTPQWKSWVEQVEDKKNPESLVNKTMYDKADKDDFISLVYGQWNYFADTKQQTKATFSMDIPVRAMKILSYKEDIVMDPFMGSGTSAVAAEFVGRNWVGIELSPNYTEVANKRLLEYRAKLLQTKLELEEVSKF
jgi:site-specific DNA-methyltransferase (adenine-specific)